MDRYAVMGNPVAHSKSPRIHALFAGQTNQQLQYDAILVEKDGFREAVADFLQQGGKGLNITVPFKEEAWTLAATRSDRAERAGAVNTLVLNESGRHFGDNTDGAGLVRDLLHNHSAVLKNKRLLLVGAGGAARGVIEPLLGETGRCERAGFRHHCQCHGRQLVRQCTGTAGKRHNGRLLVL
jgi:shikimate dehydrogenase